MKRSALYLPVRRALRHTLGKAGRPMSRQIVTGVATCLTVAGGLLIAVSLPAAVGAAEAPHEGAGSGWSTISAGGLYTCGVRPDHTLWCWGDNSVGQLGLGDAKTRTSPIQVGVASDWVGLATGFDHTCAIRTDHSLWCWGSDRGGQLGLGPTGKRKAPTQVGAGTDWTGVTAGYTHTCGIRSDHTLWCWGGGSFAGQLGLGDLTDRSSPTQVGTRTDWAMVKAGDSHTCATRTDHTLWCWGYNGQGQLGLGDFTDRSSPTQVGSRTDWADLSAGDGYHTCATRTDHTLWCWGHNGVGQLGLGDTTNRTTPSQVGTASDWYGLSAGHKQTCATRPDHSLWCWGLNNSGQLGVGDTTDRTVPTQVGIGVGWAAVSAGGSLHTCAIRSDHTLWCWGYNAQGQLGLGDRDNRTVPARV